MEWKMEWNSEHTQLQLTRVTGAAQPRSNYPVYHSCCCLTSEAFMSKFSTARHHASISKHGTVASPSCFVIVVFQSQTIIQNTTVWLHETVVMELSLWLKT